MRREKAKVEDPVVRRALHELGVPSIPVKLVAGSETGRPDQIFLIPGGRPLFIEFKWGDLTPDPKQTYWHKILRDLGYDVEVHNNVEAALQSIAAAVVAAAVHEEGRQVPARTWRGGVVFGSWLEKNEHYARSLQFLKEAKSRK